MNDSQKIVRDFKSKRRSARVLVGWLPSEPSFAWIEEGQEGVLEYRRKVDKAAAAVALRTGGVEQNGCISDPPPELTQHVQALRKVRDAAPFLQSGWRVAIVDLTKVFAVQSYIYLDQAQQRIGPHADILSIAEIALPTSVPPEAVGRFDKLKKMWIFSSPDPNLKFRGFFCGGVHPLAKGFGFLVSVCSSFLQVGAFKGRWLLCDGYHRASGFLQCGITKVPALVGELGSLELLIRGDGTSLPEGAFLGPNPPRLPDYLDETVSLEVQMSARQRTLLIQAMEVSADLFELGIPLTQVPTPGAAPTDDWPAPTDRGVDAPGPPWPT